ncbi:3-methyl-2-oxobutanoate hydroxymethyltransferase [bacterium BMS3Abin02]|nr:3-methyl-2-oxobutanoate hydroxymethyltransferase [bacterium BMS3Abin02]GBE21157.1 3-methyl-2-oxobutanoate hydroxymethyltransferase [bacterium BMS3Bbin01]HDH25039.1 3-methyl-2-oxobutanoate hydroxymethyltransferase [Actinomycetota bacterium]HDL49434.1 3-methyl-2-oxobutanoate hydroxymethyltransferase [Actinomycetota bacterium]
MAGKITVPHVRSRKGGEKLTVVTAYDTPGARIADAAGVDMILVGDSLANVVLGYEDTLRVDVDVMVHHTAAVARANTNALVIGDMPWMSYHVSIEDAVRNAGRLVREGGAEAVKLEGGRKRIPVIEAIIDAEIPVMGHLGLTPQSVHAMGGYKVQGKTSAEAMELLADALALAEAGVFSMVLEGIPDLLAELVTKEVEVPTIGIGAGVDTDGQVLVFHDVLGLNTGHVPKFVRQYANLHDVAVDALKRYVADVRSGGFPGDDETYHMSEQAGAELLEG